MMFGACRDAVLARKQGMVGDSLVVGIDLNDFAVTTPRTCWPGVAPGHRIAIALPRNIGVT